MAYGTERPKGGLFYCSDYFFGWNRRDRASLLLVGRCFFLDRMGRHTLFDGVRNLYYPGGSRAK